MKQSINEYGFRDAFENMGRGEQFSYAGLKALYNYIEDFDEQCGMETELDVIALCCEYTEYEDLQEFWNDYDKDDFPDIESITYMTTVIEINSDSFIIQSF